MCGLRRRVAPQRAAAASARRHHLRSSSVRRRAPTIASEDAQQSRGEGLDARFGGAEPLCAPLVARRVAFGELSMDDVEARGADVPLESVALERGRRRRELPPREIGLLRREIGLQQRGAQLLVVLDE